MILLSRRENISTCFIFHHFASMRRLTLHVAIPCTTFCLQAQRVQWLHWLDAGQSSSKAVNRKERNGEFHCQSLIRGMCLPCYIQVSSKYILSYSDLSSFLEVSLTFLSIFITLMAMSQREYIVHDSKKSITTCMIMIENYILSISWPHGSI